MVESLECLEWVLSGFRLVLMNLPFALSLKCLSDVLMSAIGVKSKAETV